MTTTALTFALLAVVLIPLALAYFAATAWLAAVVTTAVAAAAFWRGLHPAVGIVAVLIALPLIVAAIPPLRRALVTDRLFDWFRKVLPAMSDTEREALESGTTWWDAELFSGRPDWKKLMRHPAPSLSADEQAFLDGPVEELCQMLDEWQIYNDNDLPPEVWDHLKKHRFFSMIIPKEYGGLGFSAQGNAAVVTKIASRNQTAATTVMVPNSLGPGELLHHFGTDEQKNHYLPRLASGEDIPCFALTSPLAGSDAASMPDRGIVCKGEYQGEEVLGLRVSWDKRYITLAPVATLVGLAFKAYDPDGLLGDETSLGITCALIPADTPGVDNGKRHIPGGSPFLNGPTRGNDVFVPMDWVIGGQERVGQGWRMLMHCLSAGRAISLPSLSVASCKLASRVTGAYARVRYQFKQPIGNFEGIQEPLSRIAGETYRMEAAHKMTLVALDQGEKPAVLSAILKANLTEAYRRVITDAMDVHGGKTVIMGPRNYLGLIYQSVPVAITVEGANILTRSMIIFGQGAIRCHPWLLKEMTAATSQAPDARAKFDRALFGHAGYTITNCVRSLALGLTGGRISRAPVAGPVARHYQRINRLTANFTLIADTALLILGGRFKFAERLSGRLADALSHLYIASAVLKRFEDEGRPEDDLPLVDWGVADSLHRVEEALLGVLANFPSPFAASVLRRIGFPYGRAHPVADDRTGKRVARILLGRNPSLERLSEGSFRPTGDIGAAMVLDAFDAVLAAEEVERAVVNGLKQQPTPVNVEELARKAIDAGLVNEEQARLLVEAQRLTAEVIAVDEFDPDALSHAQFGKAESPLKAAS
ncbi:MAG: acyl-CoA dehydrogenase [Wenzhouxiangellaceae bacterium]|nr:acyl-CoA dehydrogenase [Wenzhouxiangellaceae bacterium]